MNNLQYYQSKINKAVAYLNNHLGDELKIGQLAQEANFSVFHFQRLYKALQNETPYDTLLRLRLEKSVFLLKHSSSMKVSDIAFECGFPSLENYSRQFKSRFGFAPSVFKKDKNLQNSRIYQEPNQQDFYTYIKDARKADQRKFDVTIEKLNAIPITFVRAIFGADGSVLIQRYQELMNWAESNKININGNLKRFGMSIDNPEVTPANKYRYDFALASNVVSSNTEGVEIGAIPNGIYATAHVKGKLQDVAQAWDYLYKVWLPQSGYVPIHYPALEEFVQGPEKIGWENFNIKCRIPIEKMKEI